MRRAVSVIVGVASWLACLASLAFVPVSATWLYATIWVGITVLMTAYFVFGYAIFSNWRGSQEGLHVLVFSSLILLVSVYSFVYRINVGPPEQDLTEIAGALYFSVAVWISLAWLMIWRSFLWTSLQIRARRRRRQSAATKR